MIFSLPEPVRHVGRPLFAVAAHRFTSLFHVA